jgi:hypothetical protein
MMKEKGKQNNLFTERREDEITNSKEVSQTNQPLPQPKDFEEIEY